MKFVRRGTKNQEPTSKGPQEPSLNEICGESTKEEKEGKSLGSKDESLRDWKTPNFIPVRESRCSVGTVSPTVEEDFSEFEWVISEDEEPKLEVKVEEWKRSKVLTFSNKFLVKAI